MAEEEENLKKQSKFIQDIRNVKREDREEVVKTVRALKNQTEELGKQLNSQLKLNKLREEAKINTENINNSHLPSSINVMDNEIIGGIDDGQVLFKNRENLSK